MASAQAEERGAVGGADPGAVETARRQSGRLGPALFVGATFASAFLIFLVQPMVGKRILPWFGGVPAVWTLCIAFFQTTLFVGYAYAHCLIRFVRPSLQLPVHALVFGGALFALPVLPPDRWKPSAGAEPSVAILAMLAVHVAMPFLALSATGPLVQAWFARRYPSRSPYPLYAVSNLGSFLALLAYPFFLEPRLSLSSSGRLWSLAFVATGAAVLASAALARRDAAGARPVAEAARAALRPAQIALWLLLPGCAVVLMMAVTNFLCLDVASVPFLWVLPLGVYLATFVLCFGSERVYRRAPYVLLTAAVLIAQPLVGASSLGGDALVVAIANSIQLQVLVNVVLLFGVCMVLHGELYRLRPPATALTAFYLCLSAGGALGGLFVALVAPRIFADYHEFELGLSLAWLLFVAACWQDPRGWLRRDAPRWRRGLALALTAVVLPYFSAQVLRQSPGLAHQERTFFGVLRVLVSGRERNLQRSLYNGTTLHGIQFPNTPARPTGWAGMLTGIGLALRQQQPAGPVSVGVVGLGIGTLAAYGRPGDRFRFYEIDPAVIRLARDERFFTNLAISRAQVEVVEGDGRIALASERDRGELPRFDFLVIDAFSSDAIPMHLLTREAVALYLQALKEDGLLAFHVSNRHFDLVPVLDRLGDDAGLRVASIESDWLPRYLSASSMWVLLGRDEERIQALVRFAEEQKSELDLPPDAIKTGRPAPGSLAGIPLWTDDHSDLFGAMRPLPGILGADRGR